MVLYLHSQISVNKSLNLMNKMPLKTVQRLAHSVAVDMDLKNKLKPFSSIPGPTRLPVIGTLLPYKLGIKSLKDYHIHITDLYKKYGPVVKEDFGGQIIIHVFDPKDIQTVYEADGKVPFIPPLQETTQLYRKSKDMSPGLGNVNGPQWYKLRHAVQQMMLRPREVSHYLPLQDRVAQLAVSQLSHYLHHDGSVPRLEDWVAKWILESAGTVCFETSLGCFNGTEKEQNVAQQLIEANRRIFQITADLKFSLRLYRFFKSPKYKDLLKLEDFFYGISTDFINSTISTINNLLESKCLNEGQYSFLSYLMSRDDLSHKDVVTITLSLFSDGLSTTVPTLLGNIHCLALNPEVQEKIYKEAQQHIGDEDITPKDMANMSYLKAFVKEVFRFYPIGETVQRLTQKDLVLHDYLIPSGTYVDLNPYIWLRDENIFPEPHKILPERWLRRGNKLAGQSQVHPYILNPFSIGTRMCAGRRFAEQDLYVGISRLVKKYKVVALNNNEPAQEWKTLLYPKLPLPIKFVPRQ